jgi:NAD-dependent DNA ligase
MDIEGLGERTVLSLSDLEFVEDVGDIYALTEEQLLQIDSGSLYITNKRIIFVGSKKNANIQLSKVLSVTPYSDGVGIEKDSGKSPILRVSTNSDLLAMTLGRVINDLQN